MEGIDGQSTPNLAELRIDDTLALLGAASPTVAERLACLLLAQTLDDDAEPDAGERLVDALAARGDAATPLLQALAALGPPVVAQYAATQVPEGADAPPPPLALEGLHAIPLDTSEVLLAGVRRDGEDLLLGNVIIEDGPRLVAASLGPPGADEPLDVLVADVAGAGVTTYVPELAEAQRRVVAGAEAARAAGAGVGTETLAALPLIARALGLEPGEVWGLSAGGGPSTLIAELGNEIAFRALVEEQVESLEVWMLERYDEAVELEALALELLLEFKWGAGERDLGRWMADDLAALVLDALPDTGIDTEIVLELPMAIATALAFLDARGQLAGEPLPALELALEDMAHELQSRFGAPAARKAPPSAKARASRKRKRQAARRSRRRNR